jgi:hypothetical protein
VIVTDALPPNMKCVSADTPQGTWWEANGVVTFRLGLLEAVYLKLHVTVIPTAPGQATNVAKIRGNEREQNLMASNTDLPSWMMIYADPGQEGGDLLSGSAQHAIEHVIRLGFGSEHISAGRPTRPVVATERTNSRRLKPPWLSSEGF